MIDDCPWCGDIGCICATPATIIPWDSGVSYRASRESDMVWYHPEADQLVYVFMHDRRYYAIIENPEDSRNTLNVCAIFNNRDELNSLVFIGYL